MIFGLLTTVFYFEIGSGPPDGAVRMLGEVLQDRYITGPRDAIDLSPYMREGSYEQRRFQGLEQYLLNQLNLLRVSWRTACGQVLQLMTMEDTPPA